MLDAFIWLLAGLLDGLISREPSPQRRAYEAYREAWKENGRQADLDGLELLRTKFKEHSAPGAYVDPDGAPLAPWIAAWRAGLAPRNAAGAAKSARRSNR